MMHELISSLSTFCGLAAEPRDGDKFLDSTDNPRDLGPWEFRKSRLMLGLRQYIEHEWHVALSTSQVVILGFYFMIPYLKFNSYV